MIQAGPLHSTPPGKAPPIPFDWLQWIPDGALSVEAQGNSLVLRASQALQDRFEDLLERRKSGTLMADETHEYEAICRLDDSLSWLNRLARNGSGE